MTTLADGATGAAGAAERATPLVSVVIPVHDNARTIASTLASVAAQTVPDLEVVVVDDGSRDDSVEVVRATHPEVTVIRQPNRGTSLARNAGIVASRGRWVAALDADDLWLPNRLERLMAYLERHPDCRAVATTVLTFVADEDAGAFADDPDTPVDLRAPRATLDAEVLAMAARRVTGPVPEEARVLDRPTLLEHSRLWTTTMLVERETLLAAGLFSPQAGGMSDYAASLALARIAPIHLVDDPTLLYRLRPAQRASRPDLDLRALALLVAEHFGSVSAAHPPELELMEEFSATYRWGPITRSLRAAAARREPWRRRVTLALATALLPRRSDRIRVHVTAWKETVKAGVPGARALGRGWRTARSRLGRGRSRP